MYKVGLLVLYESNNNGGSNEIDDRITTIKREQIEWPREITRMR